MNRLRCSKRSADRPMAAATSPTEGNARFISVTLLFNQTELRLTGLGSIDCLSVTLAWYLVQFLQQVRSTFHQQIVQQHTGVNRITGPTNYSVDSELHPFKFLPLRFRTTGNMLLDQLHSQLLQRNGVVLRQLHK